MTSWIEWLHAGKTIQEITRNIAKRRRHPGLKDSLSALKALERLRF